MSARRRNPRTPARTTPQLLTPAEASAATGLSMQRLSRLARRGLLANIQPAGYRGPRRYRADEIRAIRDRRCFEVSR